MLGDQIGIVSVEGAMILQNTYDPAFCGACAHDDEVFKAPNTCSLHRPGWQSDLYYFHLQSNSEVTVVHIARKTLEGIPDPSELDTGL